MRGWALLVQFKACTRDQVQAAFSHLTDPLVGRAVWSPVTPELIKSFYFVMALVGITRKTLVLGVLLVVACGEHHAGRIAALPVSRVVSAHHGICPPASNRAFGERAARLFSVPIPYLIYNCLSQTEATLLGGGCGRVKPGHNTVFISFHRVQTVRFVQDGYQFVARVRTFGEDWDFRFHRAQLYFAVKSFPKPPPPPGEHVQPYRGPEMYGEFGAAGDPLGAADEECPTG